MINMYAIYITRDAFITILRDLLNSMSSLKFCNSLVTCWLYNMQRDI